MFAIRDNVPSSDGTRPSNSTTGARFVGSVLSTVLRSGLRPTLHIWTRYSRIPV